MTTIAHARHRRHHLLVVGAAVACGCGNAAQQADCEELPFTLVHEVTLGSDAGPFSPTQYSTLAVDARGMYIVAPTHTPGAAAVYSSSGHFMQSWGNEGSGPGEYRGLVGITVVGDSIMVADSRAFRISVLEADGTFRRSFAVNGAIRSITQLSRDSLLVYATPFPGSDKGALQLFAQLHEPVRTFPDPRTKPQHNSPQSARVVSATDSFIVAGMRTSYAFELFYRNGDFARELSLKRSWFKGVNPARVIGRRGTGVTLLQSTAGGDANVLWTLSLRENEDAARFEAAARAEPHAMEGMSVSLQDSVFDYYLDRLSLTSGCSLHTARLRAGVFTRFAAGAHVRLLSVREIPGGELVLDVWRVADTSEKPKAHE